MSSRFRSLVALAVASLAVPLAVVAQAPAASAAVSIRDGFTDSVVTGSLGAAVDVTDLPDGRMLVAAQDGQVWVVAVNGTKVATPAVSISGLCRANEQGLLGIDVDPDVATNGFVYLYYTHGTSSPSCENRVSRFTLTGNTLANEQILIDHIASLQVNHEGGDIQLGKDGNLYISSGDDANGANAQDLSNLAGKILRIKTDGTIPSGNPFTASDSASCANGAQSGKKCQEIFAYGFRNPFRIAADPNAADTRIFVNDVGLDTAEEVDILVAGGNYGWPTREGLCASASRNDCHAPLKGNPTASGLIDPIAEYTHVATGCEAITGGAFVPNDAWPARYSGAYLYGDEVCGKMWVLLPDGAGGWTSEDFAQNLGPLTSMRTVKQSGVWSVVYTTFANGGELHRIASDAPSGQTQPSAFHPLTPTRILDTRSGVGYTGRKPSAGDTLALKVTGTGSGVPADAVAVALNLTATEATAAGYITAWPTGETRPLTSVLNLAGAADTSANAVIARLGAGGQVNLFTQSGTHLVADVTGYWTETASSKAGRYTPAPTPARLLDTRAATGIASTTIVPAGGTVDLQVAGRGGVPATGVSAVALVVTVTNTATSGFVTAWPSGTTKPLVSTVNPVGANDIRSNLVLLPIGTNGKVSLYTLQATHLVVDIAGWFSDDSAAASTTGLLVASSPQRVVATPDGNPFGRLTGGTPVSRDYSSVVGTGAIAIVHNLTIDASADAGFLTAWPAGSTAPTASNVNWSGPRQTRAALAISSLAAAGRVSYSTNVATDLFVDRFGYFTA